MFDKSVQEIDEEEYDVPHIRNAIKKRIQTKVLNFSS